MFAYVGSRTTRERNARGNGITVYQCNQDNGELSLIQEVGDLINPSYLVINRQNSRLYSVHGDKSEVSAFEVDALTGHLTFINSCTCEGLNPVHLALDASERFLIVSNHLDGSVCVLSITESGELGSVVQKTKLKGKPGPHKTEQPFSKPHFNLFSPNKELLIVPDKGLDCIFSFRFDNGKLYESKQVKVNGRECSGPRHAIFHPNGIFLYVVNELDSTVTTYAVSAATGEMTPLQVLPSLSPYFTDNNRAAAIIIDSDGRFLYASNRGADDICTYEIDGKTGLLSYSGSTETEGETPRFITLSPNGKYLFALNENSDNIVTFKINPNTGIPTRHGVKVKAGSPVCMIFSY